MGAVRRCDRWIRAIRGVLRERRVVRVGRRKPLRRVNVTQRLLIEIERMVTSGELSVTVDLLTRG